MHCPSCGNESSLDQKFCRKCGFSLEVVGKLLSEHPSTGKKLELEEVSDEKLALRRMVSWMMWGLLIVVIGLVLIVTNKQFLMDRLFNLLGSFLLLGGISVATYGVLDAMRGGGSKSKRAKLSEETKNEPDELAAANTTKELAERIPVPVPSVTERTTQLIENEIGHARREYEGQ